MGVALFHCATQIAKDHASHGCPQDKQLNTITTPAASNADRLPEVVDRSRVKQRESKDERMITLVLRLSSGSPFAD